MHHDIGVGWDVPMSWTVNEQGIQNMRQAQPQFVGVLTRTVNDGEGNPLGNVQVILQSANQGLSKGTIPEVIKTQIAAGTPFSEENLTEVTYSGMPGYIYDVALPPQMPQSVRAMIVSNGVRSFIGIIRGPQAAVDWIKDDLQELFDGIRERHIY